MEKFLTVRALVDWCGKAYQGAFSRSLNKIIDENKGFIQLLELLEAVNPCGQEYYVHKDIILITYHCKLNLLSFRKALRLKVGTKMIGLPISISRSGIWTCDQDDGTSQEKVQEALMLFKGLTVVLNSDLEFPGQNRTLSNYVFQNRFTGFDQYLLAMRSSYRRQHRMALQKGEDLSFHKVSLEHFTTDQYQLYQSIMARADYPLEVLSIEFFRRYPAEIFEVRDSSGRLLAFIQMKGIGETLHFMFCGFQREGKATGISGDSATLYQNMLLFIIRPGIEQGYKRINLGQTSAETKLKLGCVEEKKYLYARHSNPMIDAVLRRFSGMFSEQGYPTEYRVFKADDGLDGNGAVG